MQPKIKSDDIHRFLFVLFFIYFIFVVFH